MAPELAAVPAETEPERPAITIRFAGPQSAELAILCDPTVTDGQLYAAAWVLDAMAHEVRAQLVRVADPASLARVPASFLNELRRAGRV